MIRAGFIVGIITILFLLSPQSSHAAPKPRCTEPNPGSTPVITSTTTKDTTVTLTWTESLDPVTHYTLAYGLEKDALLYGAPNVGAKGTTSYTVEQLTKGQKYYFRIRAVNNCEPGDFSDTVSVIAGVGELSKVETLPNLSLHKKVLETSLSAEKSQEIKKGMTVLGAKTSSQCGDCMSVPLLVSEIIVLLAYFTFAHRVVFFKPIYAVFIPIGFYLYFLFLNRNCNSYFFFCEYFGILSLIAFIVILLIHKQLFLHKLLSPHLVEEKRGKRT